MILREQKIPEVLTKAVPVAGNKKSLARPNRKDTSMQLKSNFILRQVAGENVVIPTGDALNLNLMITLNETGAFLWKLLEQDIDEEAMVAALLAEYDVDEASARAHVTAFVTKLKEQDFLA